MTLPLTFFEVQLNFVLSLSRAADSEERDPDPEDALLSAPDEDAWCDVVGYFEATSAAQALQMAAIAHGHTNPVAWCDCNSAGGEFYCSIEAVEVQGVPSEPMY